MKVKTKTDLKLLGTDIHLIAGKVYDAIPATNQPDYAEKAKIFVQDGENAGPDDGFMLEKDDYITVIHDEASLRAQDGEFENYHYQLEDGDQYVLTDAEWGWVEFIAGKYCISDHITEHTKKAENGDLVYTIDIEAMSKALEDDQMFPKAVMLSDDTVLQAIFFYTAQEQGEKVVS